MRSKRGDGILRGRDRIYFVTRNRGKYAEANQVARAFGVELRQLKLEKLEVQADDLSEIASFSARRASQAGRRPVVAEDSGFFVHALGGFPGPYSSYVSRTIGNLGILRLLGSTRDRSANFRAAVSFCRPKGRPVCFTGIVNGSISDHPEGTRGFGFDPIFRPRGGDGLTFAQMRTDEKNLLSHRAKAFAKFFRWFSMRTKSA
jgi:XTP/dITP diphosphohydrolase